MVFYSRNSTYLLLACKEFSRVFEASILFVHSPRAKATFLSSPYLHSQKAAFTKKCQHDSRINVRIESIPRESKSQKIQPHKRKQQPAASKAQTPKSKGNSLRKSDSQLYSTAANSPVCLSLCRNQSTNDTYNLLLPHRPLESSTPTHTHTPQSCRQAKCKRSWRCPASSSRTALNSSTAARMSILLLLPLLPLVCTY